MKVLLCTHHLQTWGGSELVCIELFEALVARGCEVSVYCPFATPAFIQIAFGNWLRVEGVPARIDLEAFDLVLVSHQCLSRLWTPAFERRFASLRRRPFLIYFHLSPHEPFEQPGPFVERALADVIYANSEETRDALVNQGFAGIRLFRNPAPAAFAAPPSRSRDLRRLLSISNHLPAEVGEAFEILKARGIEVTRIGSPHASRRVTPRDLESHEAVVTIGKSVQYAIRSRRPVFCYDHFQGPGWLGPLMAATEATNFSDRCSRIPLSGPNLAERILDGFAAARNWIAQADPAEFGRFFLERSVDEILELARLSRRRWHWTLLPGGVKRHRDFETERRLYDLVDRSYAAGSSLPAPAGPALPSLFRTHRAIETKMLRPPKPGEAMVIAVFSYRYDAHLVPHLIENIAPAVHGYAALDDRMAGDMLSAETGRQKALFETARNMGARWVFAVDPDERFEDRLKDQMPALTTGYGPVVWTFECRELFHPTRYRIDGLWSGRPRARLFPCIAGMEPGDTALHGLWTRNHWKLPVKASGLDFYHLRMITPERRALRRALYASADLGRAFQDIGYDYLDDERGMQLREIPGDRGFTPPHVEDHG
ncbi:MAG: glycosyltransferase, partial [Albidovulum sp.]|uniref:glycosyltransferase n=1 Tax=Albidovulum sp. TaxID=1872424 RepID=UPI003C9C3EB3